MNSLISVNYKFKDISPKRLAELVINNSKYTKGFEIFFNIDDNSDISYIKDLANECFKNNLILQIHGDSSLSIEKQIEYLKLLEQIYDITRKQIILTIHPVQDNDKNQCIQKTYNYITEMLKNCDKDKIKICLENLNDFRQNEDRPNKEDIIPIVCNIDNLYMTYDIGHEIIECGKIININKDITSLISNVHIHSYSYEYSGGYDHKPIQKNDIHWNEIIKGIMFLKNINYNGNVTFEYDLLACEGNTIEEKVVCFLNSIDYVSERF